MTFGKIKGFVYIDDNNNGIKDVGEVGIAGVTLVLLGTDINGNAVNRTTTTAADGSYSFGVTSSLVYGTYSITETQPVSYLDGKDTIGTPVSTTTVTNDKFSTIKLNSTSNNLINYNFGELRPAAIAGSVYLDSNSNGIKETGETAIAGVSLTLSGTNDLGQSVSRATTTTADGSYSFGNLRPGTYMVTETQPANYLDGLDAKNGVVIVGSASTDTIGSIVLTSGVTAANNTFGERPLYSPLTPTLGYVTNGILLQPIENTQVYGNQAFLKLEVGQSFIQTIALSNTGNSLSDPNAALAFTVTNNPFVQLDYIWNDTNNNNSLDSGETVYSNGQALGFSLNPGQQIVLKASSKVINGDNSLIKQNFTFQLQDDTNNPNDLGNATANTTLYLSQTGFNKQAGSTAFSFAALADSTLAVTITGNTATQAAKVPRAAGTLTEGAGGQTPGLPHFIGLSDFDGDADGIGAAKAGTINSDPIALTNFQVVWKVPPGADFAAFQNNGNLSSPNSAFNNTNGTFNDSVIELFNNGYFSQAYADSSINKSGQTVPGVLQGSSSAGAINQVAVAGNINQVSLSLKDYFSGSFDTFISQNLTTPAGVIWRVNIKNASTGTSSANALSWSTYNPLTQPKIAVIQLSSTFPSASQFYISAGNGSDNLDLSQLAIFLANGNRIGATIDGGNGQDRIRGTSDNDTLIGGNAKDIFVFGINSGIDTVIDFKTAGASNNADLLDLKELGITQANVLSLLDATSSGGNGNGQIDAGDRGVTSVNSGSTSSLSINLSYFGDLKSNLSPNPNGPFNTNTTVILRGVTSLSNAFFAA